MPRRALVAGGGGTGTGRQTEASAAKARCNGGGGRDDHVPARQRRLDRRSHKTLDALAQIVKGCPGSPSRSRATPTTKASRTATSGCRSAARSRCCDYLVQGRRAGSASLAAVGYGETKPKVPNDSPANMALNRRIEFSVKAK